MEDKKQPHQWSLFKAEKLDNHKTTNPMLKWGAGPIGKKCKDCSSLVYHQYSKRYYKCKRRGISNGAGTDHRVNWQCCVYFEDNNG